jgi:hypothetical protein
MAGATLTGKIGDVGAVHSQMGGESHAELRELDCPPRAHLREVGIAVKDALSCGR